MIEIKRLGLFALVIPFSKFALANAVVPRAAQVMRAKDLQCDQLQALVEANGSVQLTTNFEFINDLYVFESDACAGGRAERTRIVTSDSPSCLVGWKCEAN